MWHSHNGEVFCWLESGYSRICITDLSYMSIPEDGVQDTLSKAQELWVSEGFIPPKENRKLDHYQKRRMDVAWWNNCSWCITRFGSLENKRKLFFYPHDFESLWSSMLILNYLIICLYYGMKLFWSVYSTFLSQLSFFCILGFYSNFQPAPLSEID